MIISVHWSIELNHVYLLQIAVNFYLDFFLSLFFSSVLYWDFNLISWNSDLVLIYSRIGMYFVFLLGEKHETVVRQFILV